MNNINALTNNEYDVYIHYVIRRGYFNIFKYDIVNLEWLIFNESFITKSMDVTLMLHQLVSLSSVPTYYRYTMLSMCVYAHTYYVNIIQYKS